MISYETRQSLAVLCQEAEIVSFESSKQRSQRWSLGTYVTLQLLGFCFVVRGIAPANSTECPLAFPNLLEHGL